MIKNLLSKIHITNDFEKDLVEKIILIIKYIEKLKKN